MGSRFATQGVNRRGLSENKREICHRQKNIDPETPISYNLYSMTFSLGVFV